MKDYMRTIEETEEEPEYDLYCTPLRKYSFVENTDDPFIASRTYVDKDGQQGIAYRLTSTFRKDDINGLTPPSRYYGNWGNPVVCNCRLPGSLVVERNMF